MLRKIEKKEGHAREADAASLGQRERNKRDKLQRIKNAAYELFISKGYDDTTTREIALRAGVGMGTVFTYADNKRDLLFLVANEDLAAITRRAEADISKDASLLSNLLVIFRDHYEYFARQPELSRLMLREMQFYASGSQADRFKAIREHFISLINQCVQMAQARREISLSYDYVLIGWVIFSVYQVESRRWLSGKKLDLPSGMAQLEQVIGVVITGIAPEKTGKAHAGTSVMRSGAKSSPKKK
jgi:AcrR family transcriptional regulator